MKKRTKMLIEDILQSHTYTLRSSWQGLTLLWPWHVIVIIFKYVVVPAPPLHPKLF